MPFDIRVSRFSNYLSRKGAETDAIKLASTYFVETNSSNTWSLPPEPVPKEDGHFSFSIVMVCSTGSSDWRALLSNDILERNFRAAALRFEVGLRDARAIFQCTTLKSESSRKVWKKIRAPDTKSMLAVTKKKRF